MFCKSISESKAKILAVVSIVLFMITAVCYFIPGVEIPHKISFPLAVLSVFSLWLIPVPMSLAMFFSAFGDYFGSCNNFMAQMESFAVAHLFIILYFVQRLFRIARSSDKTFSALMTGSRTAYVIFITLCVLFVAAMAVVKIVPQAPEGVVRAGVTFYIFIISIMLYTALLQRSVLYALGAVSFVFSDFVLAWNKFVEPLQYEDILIMVPYYLAQLLFFFRSIKCRSLQSIRTDCRKMR